jgi:S1-C subfamily serine protease
MSGNAKFRWFLLAPIVLALLVVTSADALQEGQPPNSYFRGSSWYCESGYKKSGNSCVNIFDEMGGQPPNSYFRGSSWYCESGYKKSGNSCVNIFSEMGGQPPNSYFRGSSWYCESGYKKSGNSCVNIFTGKSQPTISNKIRRNQSPITQPKPTIPLAPAKDIVPPSIDIASFITVKEETPIIRGRVSDGSKVLQVTVEGRQTDLKKNGVFSFKRYVPSGESSIRIVAIDEWGNKSQKDVRIKRIVTAKIPTPKKPKSGSGSGFFVSKMGHVITNAHVVNNCNKVTIGDNANKQVPAEVVNTDKSNDLALLKLSTLEMASAESKSLIQKLGIVVVPLASKGLLRDEDVRLGEKVLVAGYPFGEFFSDTIKVTVGVVSATRGAGDDSGQFQLDAAVQPGNSGGPIYDSGGNIVGVVISQLDKLKMAKAIGSMPENVNFGIKASTVRQFLTSSGLPSKKSERTEEKSTEQLAEIAQNQALMVMCLQ